MKFHCEQPGPKSSFVIDSVQFMNKKKQLYDIEKCFHKNQFKQDVFKILEVLRLELLKLSSHLKSAHLQKKTFFIRFLI